MALQEQEIQVFINGTRGYFETLTAHPVELGTPYIARPSELPRHDYTGVIGVSGERKGCVYFTAPRILLRYLLLSLGEHGDTPELLRDLVGEVANTISGNARTEFGPHFLISVPLVIEGKPDSLALSDTLNAIVIPMKWQNYSAALVACLE